MTRYEVLEKAYQMAQHNMAAYGTNWGASPKEGMGKEWLQAKEEAGILKAMMDEECCFFWDPETEKREVARMFIGTVDSYSVKKTYDGKANYVDEVEISTKTVAQHIKGGGQRFKFGIQKEVADEWLLGTEYKLDVERHKRYDEGKSHYLHIWVNSINNIFHMEWEEE